MLLNKLYKQTIENVSRNVQLLDINGVLLHKELLSGFSEYFERFSEKVLYDYSYDVLQAFKNLLYEQTFTETDIDVLLELYTLLDYVLAREYYMKTFYKALKETKHTLALQIFAEKQMLQECRYVLYQNPKMFKREYFTDDIILGDLIIHNFVPLSLLYGVYNDEEEEIKELKTTLHIKACIKHREGDYKEAFRMFQKNSHVLEESLYMVGLYKYEKEEFLNRKEAFEIFEKCTGICEKEDEKEENLNKNILDKLKCCRFYNIETCHKLPIDLSHDRTVIRHIFTRNSPLKELVEEWEETRCPYCLFKIAMHYKHSLPVSNKHLEYLKKCWEEFQIPEVGIVYANEIQWCAQYVISIETTNVPPTNTNQTILSNYPKYWDMFKLLWETYHISEALFNLAMYCHSMYLGVYDSSVYHITQKSKEEYLLQSKTLFLTYKERFPGHHHSQYISEEGLYDSYADENEDE